MLSDPELDVRALWAAFRDELSQLTSAAIERTIRTASTPLTRALYTYEFARRIAQEIEAQSSRAPSTAQAVVIRM